MRCRRDGEEIRRCRILDAAYAVFAEKGLRDDIAAGLVDESVRNFMQLAR